jgi:dipeptidase D
LDRITNIINQYYAQVKQIFRTTDPDFKVEFVRVEPPNRVFTKETADKLLNILASHPHGVIRMSPDFPNLTETSINLATVKLNNNKLEIEGSIRSSFRESIQDVTNR